MSEEDKKLQKHLVDEMMKVSETNPDVMFYMEALMKKYEDLQQKVEQLEERCAYLERSNNRREDEIIELRDENVDLASKNNQLEKENKKLKKAVKEKVIATCNTCEDYGICPHSYREYDLENIIKEAKEYVTKKWYSKNTEDINKMVSLGNWQIDLLNILNKGSDKE